MSGIVIAIETSQKAPSVAAFRDGVGIALLEGGGREPVSQTLGRLVEAVLAACRTERSGIDGLVVSTGPGSATGLRVGIAFARGLADALEVPCAECPLLEALPRALPAGEERARALAAVWGGANSLFMRDGAGGETLTLGSADWPSVLARAGPARSIVVTADLASRLGLSEGLLPGGGRLVVVGPAAGLLGVRTV